MFFSRPKIGIDLGTTNTLVYMPKKGIVINEPSMVAISTTNQEIVAIGHEARYMLGKAPDNILPYMPLKDGVISDTRTTEAMLRYHIKKAMGSNIYLKPDVIVSVPAGVTSTERRAVIEACLRANAKTAFVIKEPILAALGADIPINEPHGNIIVDIGGGTTDVATISLGGIVAHTSIKCGGNKLNQSIIDYTKKKYNLLIGQTTAENIKISIGSAISVEQEQTLIIKGRDRSTGLPRQTKITTNEVVEAIKNDLQTMVQGIQYVLSETPPELASDIIDNGIILTGGTSLLKNIDEYIRRQIGVKVKVAEEPLLCVAKGAGKALQQIDLYKKIMQSKAI